MTHILSSFIMSAFPRRLQSLFLSLASGAPLSLDKCGYYARQGVSICRLVRWIHLLPFYLVSYLISHISYSQILNTDIAVYSSFITSPLHHTVPHLSS
jgi:hypothetical protein